MGTNAYNFDFTILHLQFHSQFYNCSFAFAFCICILSFANLHLQFSFLYGVSQNFGNKTIYNFAFLEAFAVLTLQFVNAVLCFWTTFPECICNFDISYFNCNFAFPDCHCIFCFFGMQMQFCIFWKHFYQQFASQKITKTITRRQIPAAIPEMNNIRLNARRTLFLQVLLTTCPPYFPTRIVLAPFVS